MKYLLITSVLLLAGCSGEISPAAGYVIKACIEKGWIATYSDNGIKKFTCEPIGQK